MLVKKKLTYATIAFSFLCNGIEYAIVFPTIWMFLQRLGAKNENLLGLSVAAYSIASILIEPGIGRLFDKTKNAKLLLICMNLFAMIGSCMYFLAMSPWFLFLSRFVSGIGNSGGAAMIADITSSTEVKMRTAIISNLQACRQIGLLTGPMFNLALRQLDFKFGKFTVDKLTAPGLFMAVLGVMLQLMYIFMYHNLVDISAVDKLTESLHTEYEPESDVNQDSASIHNSADCQRSFAVTSQHDCSVELDREEYVSPRVVIVNRVMNNRNEHCNTCPNSMIESAEAFMGSINEENIVGETSDCDRESPITPASVREINFKTDSDISTHFNGGISTVLKDEFLREEVIAILGLAFVSFFAQTSIETIVTPLSQKYFGFGDFENSMLFLFAGIEILLAYLSINLLSKRLEDRILILVGGIFMALSLIWFLITVPRFPFKSWSGLPYFAAGIFINLLGISLLIACSISLYSKVISREHQGLAHGVRRTVLSIGMILGPLWGGGAVNWPVVLFSVPLAVVVLFLLLFIMSFSRMEESIHQWRQCSTRLTDPEPNETSPLLT